MSNSEDFLAPRLAWRNLDRYHLRRAIVNNLRANLPQFSGTLLDVGCGRMPYRSMILSPPNRVVSYIGMDIITDNYGQPDVEWDGILMPFSYESIDCAMATEVLEHCPEPSLILAEIARVLRPGGLFFFTVPFLWPLHDVPNDEYRFTPFALERLLRKAGFTRVEMRALGGWDASLAQMIGLWVRRRPMPRIIKIFLSFLAYPAVRYLIRQDKPPTNFHESSMITGLTGIARKQHVPFEL